MSHSREVVFEKQSFQNSVTTAPSCAYPRDKVNLSLHLRIDTKPLKKSRVYVNTWRRRRQTRGERQRHRHTMTALETWPFWMRRVIYLAPLNLQQWISHSTQTVRPHLHFNVQKKSDKKRKCAVTWMCDIAGWSGVLVLVLSLYGWSSCRTVSCICQNFYSCSS